MASANPPQPAPMASVNPPPPTMSMPDGPIAPLGPSTPPAVQSQLGADTAELQRIQNNGAGLNKIHNGFLRTLARVGDAAGTVLAPGVAAAIPGTTVHNWQLQTLAGNRVAEDQNAINNLFTGQQNAANLAHTRAETASLGANDAIKSQNAQATLAKSGLKVVLDENGKPNIVPDEESPVFKKQQLDQDLIKAHTDSFNAGVELKNAQTAFNKAKVDPNSPLFKQTAQRLATAQANAAAANTRAQAYMGNYLQHSRNVDLNGNVLPGAPIISNDEGDQTVVGSTNASNAIKNQSNAAQFNDVHGALDNLEGTAKALVAKGGSINSPGIAAALARPSGTLGQWLQGEGVKANLTPEERAYVQSVASAHENIQALRKSAGGTATDSAVEKLDSMIPNASTPDINYLLGQTGQIRATATRLGKGATVAAGGLSVRGQGKRNNMVPPTQQSGSEPATAPKSYSQTATGSNGHKIGSNDGITWFDVKTGKAVK
jgi:hypothetical protein